MKTMAEVKLKENIVHTIGELPRVGQVAPDFVLVDAELSNRTLKDFSANRKMISIVPSLDTSVCSAMAKKFNEAIKDRDNIVVLVVSADLPFAQKRFCEQEHVENVKTLSMMRNRDFGKDYGILLTDGPLAGICARAVLILDQDDKVIYSELVPEITEEPNYDKALEHLL